MNSPKNKIVVVAVGGNALIRENQKGTLEEQSANVDECTKELVKIIESGYQLVLTHGNGPQVGLIMLRDAAPHAVKPPMPLFIYNAETQGQIGYQLMASLNNRLLLKNRSESITSLLTQVVVDADDPNFKNPTKPIGPFYSREEITELQKQLSFSYVEDSGRGYRKVVASPRPVEIVESRIIKGLTALGLSVISAGGGGIPVVRNEDGTLQGVEAVIDKDFTSAMLAADIEAGTLMILTGVEKIAINFNKPDMRFLDKMTLAEARKYMAEGQFPPGSMGPKVEAAIQYVESVGGRAIITRIESAVDALEGRTGTVICP
jgi:carbamate kinase